MQVYGVGFCYGSDFFEKTGFRRKRKFRKKKDQVCAKKSFFSVLGTY